MGPRSASPTLSQVLAEVRALREDLRASSRKLLTVREAAAYLGLSEKTVRNHLGAGAKKPFPVRPVRALGRVLFRRQDLDVYVERLGEGRHD